MLLELQLSSPERSTADCHSLGPDAAKSKNPLAHKLLARSNDGLSTGRAGQPSCLNQSGGSAKGIAPPIQLKGDKPIRGNAASQEAVGAGSFTSSSVKLPAWRPQNSNCARLERTDGLMLVTEGSFARCRCIAAGTGMLIPPFQPMSMPAAATPIVTIKRNALT